MRVLHIVGARPNFMKTAPIIREMAKYPDEFEQILVHTGQHYDENMSRVFFDELELPRPDVNLDVGSGSHAWQTAQVMLRFEPVVLDYKPDLVLVVGDVNSTLAVALVCVKLGVRVGHVEAGLRSFDRTMPEEYNRLLTDQIADLLFTPSRDADENLLREGIPPERIHFVGNVMIDTLVHLLPKAENRPILAKLGLIGQGSGGAGERGSRGAEEQRGRGAGERGSGGAREQGSGGAGEQGGGGDFTSAPQHLGTHAQYVLVTLHRPSNVDDPETLKQILLALNDIAHKVPVIFPVHPRTQQQLQISKFAVRNSQLHLIEPLGYLDFLALMRHAALVITDSGGIQEETTYLGVPCLTARANTERPVTVTQGTNTVVGSDPQRIVAEALAILDGKGKASGVPELWDGKAAERIVQVIASHYVGFRIANCERELRISNLGLRIE